MESWRKVWRDGVAPLIDDPGLLYLKRMLEADDPRLIQGGTTTPPPLMCVQDWPCEGACAFGMTYPDAVEGEATVGAVEEHFARMCFEVDQRLKEPAGCRFFLNWYDETPREEMRRELLGEVKLALGAREV